jgi:hypothetical protein
MKLVRDLSRNLFNLFQGARSNRHICSFARKCQGDRAANAAAAASD